MKKLTKKQLKERALKRFLKRWRAQPIKINIATQATAWPSFEPIGYVVHICTGKPWYFDNVCTVPFNPAHIDTHIYGYPVKVYDHDPVLAPCRSIGGTIEYLHPNHISAADYQMLQDFYRHQIRKYEIESIERR